MSDQTFNASRINIDRVYTRHGDEGDTSLGGGHRVAKDGARIDAYGVVEELNDDLRGQATRSCASTPPRRFALRGSSGWA